MAVAWGSYIRIAVLVVLLAAIITACFTLPIEQMLKDFLQWIDHNLGPWGPLALAVAYIPLTILAVPASILTLGGGYLFGLPIGFVADSIGATVGATVAFLLGRTIGRSYVISKLKDYPKFQAVAIAIHRSGFKIVLLLRLVPILPFNMLNYLLSVTPVGLGEYVLASWLGMMPITLALVYVGTTLKDLSDVTHGWGEISTTRWVFMILGLVVSVVLMIVVTKVAKESLDKALAENVEIERVFASPELPTVADAPILSHASIAPNSFVRLNINRLKRSLWIEVILKLWLYVYGRYTKCSSWAELLNWEEFLERNSCGRNASFWKRFLGFTAIISAHVHGTSEARRMKSMLFIVIHEFTAFLMLVCHG
ncbi:hypothetical protein NE237_015860 [Protea cynaroides]|uniref:VTT domain-containing protein n=1 Tax=Protea cynaroides TaxID=273540 RepID=A0A9Q0KF27_9MAGN|nr:hypothetical protein NE237_015860 [Protea cynaroides]